MMCNSALRMYLVRALGALCLLALFMLPCSAQSTLGSIFGTISDSSGAVIPNATIIVTSVERGTSRTVKASTDGSYRVTQLEPGNYHVSAEKQGFAKAQSEAIPVAIQAIVRADLALKAGSDAVTVEVKAANPLLETGTAEVSAQVTSQELLTLPSLDRNIVSLMTLAPGVTGGNYDPSSPNSGGRGNGRRFSPRGAGRAHHRNARRALCGCARDAADSQRIRGLPPAAGAARSGVTPGAALARRGNLC